MSPKIVVIDGNIGAGKSAVLGRLKELGFTVFEEPMDIWQPLLELRQQDPKRWALAFQLCVATHFIELEQKLKHINEPVVFVERCTLAGWAFTRMAYERAELTEVEFGILERFFWTISFSFDKLFILETAPQVCLHRIKERNRKGEEFLTLRDLKDLARNYNAVFQGKEKHIINGSKSTYEIASEILSVLMKN